MWVEIQGYDGYYSVNEFGQIKSNDRIIFNRGNNKNHKIKGKLLKQYKNNKGYLYVDLCKDGKSQHILVHRIVANAFIENKDNLPIINHKDNNPLNNSVTNLEWCNYSYNINYCIAQGRQNLNTDARKAWVCSPKQYLYKSVIQYDTLMNEINRFDSITLAGRWIIEHNFSCNKKAKSNIAACCAGKSKTAYGFIWKYLE